MLRRALVVVAAAVLLLVVFEPALFWRTTRAPEPPAWTCVKGEAERNVQNRPMTALCDDLYVEPTIEAEQQRSLVAARGEAHRNLTRFFGALQSAPVVVICRTGLCKMAFGAPATVADSDDLGFASAQLSFEEGVRPPSVVVATGPVEGTTRILTHELVHAELKAYLPYDALPTWFHEGTATLLASEPRCEGVVRPDGLDVTQLASKEKWQRHIAQPGRTRETYCASRDRVATWIDRFPTEPSKTAAMKTLLAAVAGGAAFDDAFAR